mgnify:CR=1 FL=1
MKRERRTEKQSMVTWLALATCVNTLSAAVTFAIFHFFTRDLQAEPTGKYRMLVFILALLGIGAVVGTVSALFNRVFNQRISYLTKGLRAVAEGDFSVRLNRDRAGPMTVAYQEFNKMAEELQGVQTLRSDFINNFSHEFKTPIAAVKGFAELLMEPGTSEEERKEYLQIVLEESARLADLANSTLPLSKLESQQCITNKTTFLLDEQIKRCAVLLSPSWEKKEIAFSANLEGVRYCGSEELMRHVWLNLLGNAVKYTPEGGEISVTLQTGPEEITVQVSDTGIGMSEEVQAHVFDKYYQGEQERDGKGLGLGLSIVHRIVELCGGSVEVNSMKEQGSTFTVHLPWQGI